MSFFRGSTILALVLVVPTMALAQNLDDILNRERLAVQKLFDEVTVAIGKSRTLEKAEPGQARHLLEGALAKIQNCEACPEDQRTVLRRRVNTRLAELNSHIRELQLAAEETARKEADKLKRENPGAGKSPSEIARQRVGNMKDQLAALDRIKAKQAKGNLDVLTAIATSATPIAGGVEYPKYWEQLTKNRKTITGNKLSDKEVALLKALNSTLTVDFNNARFRDVIDYLSEKSGQAIFADEGSLKEAMVEYDDPVTFRLKAKITLRTALQKILADKGLTYVIKEGAIQIVTIQKARETMVVRTYPIDDLVGTGSPQLYGPFIAYQVRMQNVQTLINNIQAAVEPALWEPAGGPGRITFFEPGNALIIRAPAELHYMLGGGLTGR